LSPVAAAVVVSCATQGPISRVPKPIDIDGLFADLATHARVALAVSGGGDSMALMFLAHEWAQLQSAPTELIVLTVDHRLRPESRDEARWVAQQAAALGLRHETLTRQPPGSRVSQARAREIRYDLLVDFACANDISAILTGHTRDDVAETFLMRLARGSGVDGLSAISSRSCWRDLPLVRPLLTVSRSELRDILRARGQTWFDDPSNADEAFERVRIRVALPYLAKLGITPARLAESAQRLRRARNAIEAATQDFIAAHVEVSPVGYVRLAVEPLADVPDEVAIHALQQILGAVAGRGSTPRLRKLEMLSAQIRRGVQMRTTLGGCLISLAPDRQTLTICREPGRIRCGPVTLRSGRTVTWDRRFLVRAGTLTCVAVLIDALGDKNIGRLPDSVRKKHPRAALACLPAVYADATLLGVALPGTAPVKQHSDANACFGAFIWPPSSEPQSREK